MSRQAQTADGKHGRHRLRPRLGLRSEHAPLRRGRRTAAAVPDHAPALRGPRQPRVHVDRQPQRLRAPDHRRRQRRGIRNPAANPLQIGRIPLTGVPPCLPGDGLEDLSPNPCATTVAQAEYEPDYTDLAKCTLSDAKDKIVQRQASAIRFRNAGMTFEIVDPTYPMDSPRRRLGAHSPACRWCCAGSSVEFRIASGSCRICSP